MKLTIIGAGNMGRAVGTRATAGGHEVEIVDRDPAEAQKLAEELGGAATALEHGAPFGGDVVVLEVVVDTSNPVDTETWDRLATPSDTSAAEELQQLAPPGTAVVKAFNTTFARTLVAGEVVGQQLDVLIAGDDDEAKRKVSQVVSDGGLRPIDVGPLSRAQQLEHLGLLHIALQQPRELGFGSTIKLHP